MIATFGSMVISFLYPLHVEAVDGEAGAAEVVEAHVEFVLAVRGTDYFALEAAQGAADYADAPPRFEGSGTDFHRCVGVPEHEAESLDLDVGNYCHAPAPGVVAGSFVREEAEDVGALYYCEALALGAAHEND